MRYLRRALPAVFIFLAGCAASPWQQLTVEPPQIELQATPFFPQELHQCGPAALATVLGADGVVVTPEQLVPQIFIPGREGSLQAELLAATRRNGRVPYVLAPQVSALFDELRAGKPVLVLQNLGLKSLPRWHYAVLVGYDSARDELILRSGREPRESMSLRRFLATWERAQRWALVVAEPGAIPASAEPARWIAAAAPFESLRQWTTVRAAYEAAAQRWPQSALVWQAQANERYARQDLAGSEAALRVALRLSPEVTTRNNLAQVLLERGCAAAAREQLDAIVQVPPALAAAVAQTRAAVAAYRGETAAGCP